MKRVLVAEDESAIREFIVINLVRSGYTVVDVPDGAKAIEAFNDCNGDFDVALLDIMMPEMDGLEVCKRLRAMSGSIGIIMLTAKAQEMDRVTGLMLGADDYVVKPFSPSELMARVDAVYRRVAMLSEKNNGGSDSGVFFSDGFALNTRNRTLTRNGKHIELTQVEFQIMEFFFKNQGVALSRTDILKGVWGIENPGEEKIVDVNIRRLRMKIEDEPSEPKHLLTVWGKGYEWV
ncbi:MAG: response regulator transcription factor [Clostridiales bacterium]|nr:response regulator transcription factor [Clostridiales bacterium]